METDTLPRVTIRDLFVALHHCASSKETTLENLRLRYCVDRKTTRAGTSLWSASRDNAAELHRLGYISGGPFPKDSRYFEQMKGSALTITALGEELIGIFQRDRGKAYDALFKSMYGSHAYLRRFVQVIQKEDVYAPVLTSLKDHVSDRYSSVSVACADAASGEIDLESFLGNLARRLRRPLTDSECKDISSGVQRLLERLRETKSIEDSAKFGKRLLDKLNDVVIPTLVKPGELGFDYRSHRILWSIGREFLVWNATTSHPEFDGFIAYKTATIDGDGEKATLPNLVYDRGLDAVGQGFLEKLWHAYQSLQKFGRPSHSAAWELRAVFCFENKCQERVFNELFHRHYAGSADYEIYLEIQRQKPKHETVLRAGQRNIGSIRVVKK